MQGLGANEIGVHYRDGTELLSGTICLWNDSLTWVFLKTWQRIQHEEPEEWDQRTLSKALAACTMMRVKRLGPEYTKIFDIMSEVPNPVVVHYQASRKSRAVIAKIGCEMDVPTEVNGVRIRRGIDGSIYIVRKDAAVEAILDKKFMRFKNELRWFPVLPSPSNVENLRQYFDGKTCTLVGKGPSLDRLSTSHLLGPVIAINESIHRVESLNPTNKTFVLQSDVALKDTCIPKRSTMFISIKAQVHCTAAEDLYIFDSRKYGISLNALSACSAIEIAKYLGAKAFRMCCFDAAMDGTLGYAKCIGYDASRGGHKNRFLQHKNQILASLGNYPVEWIRP